LGGWLVARFLGRVGAALWLLSSCVGLFAVAAKDNVLQEGSGKNVTQMCVGSGEARVVLLAG